MNARFRVLVIIGIIRFASTKSALEVAKLVLANAALAVPANIGVDATYREVHLAQPPSIVVRLLAMTAMRRHALRNLRRMGGTTHRPHILASQINRLSKVLKHFLSGSGRKVYKASGSGRIEASGIALKNGIFGNAPPGRRRNLASAARTPRRRRNTNRASHGDVRVKG